MEDEIANQLFHCKKPIKRIFNRCALSLLGRDYAVKQAYNAYLQEFFLDSEAIKERRYHHAVYVSGASGIGKSTFAKHFPSLMRSIIPSNDDTRGIAFQATMNRSVELYIDCNAAGDQFNGDIDPRLTPEKRLDIRLLARAAQFEKGLQHMISDYEKVDKFEKQCEVKNANWTHVSEVLHETRTSNAFIIFVIFQSMTVMRSLSSRMLIVSSSIKETYRTFLRPMKRKKGRCFLHKFFFFLFLNVGSHFKC